MRTAGQRIRLVGILLSFVALVRPTGAQGQGPALAGAWSDTIQAPIVAIAAAMLPTGNVLIWSSNMILTFETDIGTMPSNTLMAVLNPTTGSVTPALDSGVAADMFCPGMSMLPDGLLLVNGGSSSSHTSFYDPFVGATGTWIDGTPMNIPRGYNTDVTLSNGDVFTIGGSWSGSVDQAPQAGELWSPTAGWQRTGIPGGVILGPDLVDQAQGYLEFGDDHAWLFAMPNGRVFHAGPASQMNFFDPAARTWTPAGTRGIDPYSINGIAVMYEPGKIFKAGGAQAYTGDTGQLIGPINASASAYVIDVTEDYTDPAATPVVRQIIPLNHARAYANGVVLPDGKVFIVGGQSQPLQFTDDDSVMIPELWNPITERSVDMAPMEVPRNYHSTALLLPDGRVFVGGGGQCGDCAGDNGDIAAANHLDFNFYSPPYLFAPDGTLAVRPAITNVPATFTLGGQLRVSASPTVTSFSLVRLGSATHGIDTDQRRIPLTVASNINGSFVLNVPSDPGITVPGYYMLFALDATGVPSAAAIIHVGS